MIVTTNPDLIIETYLRFWNAEEPEQRAIAATLFTDDVEYHAVPAVVTGVDALVAFRREFVDAMGAAQYRAREAADHHHDRIRLPWEIVLANGTSFAAGTDVLDVAGDGRVRAISAFLDRAPEGFEARAHDDHAPAAQSG